MQVCERTAADKKGGHLCKRKADGKLMLRESAMCPDGDKGAFEDIAKHKWVYRSPHPSVSLSLSHTHTQSHTHTHTHTLVYLW